MAIIYSDENILFTHTRTLTPNQKGFNLHMHDNFEILCPISGDATFMAEGREYAMPSGCVLLTRPTESHRLMLWSEEPYERYVLNFRAEALRAYGFDDELLRAFCEREMGERNRYLASELGGVYPLALFKRAEEACVGLDEREKRQVVIANIAALLCSLAVAHRCGSSADPTWQEDSIGATLLAFVNEELENDISVESAARHIHMSVSQTERIFRRITGTSLYDYVLTKRLCRARELILEGLGATEAAERCGFGDYSSFYRQYKKKMGAAPSQARTMALDRSGGEMA